MTLNPVQQMSLRIRKAIGDPNSEDAHAALLMVLSGVIGVYGDDALLEQTITDLRAHVVQYRSEAAAFLARKNGGST
jgi:hypothetical protein